MASPSIDVSLGLVHCPKAQASRNSCIQIGPTTYWQSVKARAHAELRHRRTLFPEPVMYATHQRRSPPGVCLAYAHQRLPGSQHRVIFIKNPSKIVLGQALSEVLRDAAACCSYVVGRSWHIPPLPLDSVAADRTGTIRTLFGFELLSTLFCGC